jgi:hypothetical protein
VDSNLLDMVMNDVMRNVVVMGGQTIPDEKEIK